MRFQWSSPQVQRVMGFVFSSVGFWIPMIIIIFCYSSILCMLSKRLNSDILEETAQSQENLSVARSKIHLARKNVLITLCVVSFFFVLCWSQNGVLFFLFNLGYAPLWGTPYHDFTIFMIFLNCTVNPFVYVVKYKDYQIALKGLMRCQCDRETPNGSLDSLNTLSSQVRSSTNL